MAGNMRVAGSLGRLIAYNPRGNAITGTVDVDDDSVTGRIYAPWFTETLRVDCHEWAGMGVEGKQSTAGPSGDPPYYCQWDPGSEWDVEPGQDIGVFYEGPDLNHVGTAFRQTIPHVGVGKGANGEPAEGGTFAFRIDYWNNGDLAEDVVITDTMVGGMTYLTDTSGFPHTGTGAPGDPLVWNVGTVAGNWGGGFDVFVEITASESDLITNTVEITTSNPYNQSPPDERTSEWSGTVQSNDTWLGVDKWIDGPNPAPGTDFDWIIGACNHGRDSGSETRIRVISDKFPVVVCTDLFPYHFIRMTYHGYVLHVPRHIRPDSDVKSSRPNGR